MKVHLSERDHLGSILFLGGKNYDVVYIYSVISLFQQTHLESHPYQISYLAYLLNTHVFLEHIHTPGIVEVTKSHFKDFLPSF